MNVEVFIKKKKPIWDELEEILKRRGLGRAPAGKEDLEKLGRYYRAVASDFAYAKALYPGDSLVPYLNQLVARTHSHIYRRKKNDLSKIPRFFTRDFPRLFRATRVYHAFSFVLLFGFAYFGFLACGMEPELERTFLSDAYVDMTEQNIREGDPFGVYTQGSSSLMSSFIMSNNILVTFNAFALGIAFGLGTIYVLVMNGLMLGAFFHIFSLHELLGRAVSTVMIHGALELSCVVIAGGAGLHFGKALLFPGSYLRREALQIYGFRAIKLVIGLAPFLVIAGLLEGFITPLEPALPLRLGIILLSLLFLGTYLELAGRNPDPVPDVTPKEIGPADELRRRGRR